QSLQFRLVASLGLETFNAASDVGQLFQGTELSQLSNEGVMILGIERILVLELSHQQLEEVLLPQLLSLTRCLFRMHQMRGDHPRQTVHGSLLDTQVNAGFRTNGTGN